MFNHAVSEDYIRRNYAHGCTKELGIYNNKRDALTQAQQVEFLNFIRESKEYSPYYWMFEFFFETGTRCGEGIGLLWENVDFRNKFIKLTISYCMNWMSRESADFKSVRRRQSKASEKFR